MALKPIPISVLRYSLYVYKKTTDGRSGRSYAAKTSHNSLYYELSQGERPTTSGQLVQSTGLVVYNGTKDISKEDILEINGIKYSISSIQLYYDPTVMDKVHHSEILLGNVVTNITVV